LSQKNYSEKSSKHYSTIIELTGTPNSLVFQKVDYIKHYINQSSLYPEIKLTAESIVRDADITENDKLGTVKAVFNWVKEKVYYIKEFPETFKAPWTMLEIIQQEGRVSGDCDDFTILLGSLLRSLGFRVAVVITQSRNKNTYTHVFLQVKLNSNGKWMSLDPTAKNRPMGWNTALKKARRFAL